MAYTSAVTVQTTEFKLFPCLKTYMSKEPQEIPRKVTS